MRTDTANDPILTQGGNSTSLRLILSNDLHAEHLGMTKTPTCNRTFFPVSQASTVATSAKYEQRIRDIERSTFCMLIWSTSGDAGPAATRFLKRLADKLSEKTEEPYCTTMGWLRYRLGFALTRSTVMCLRGSRSRVGQSRCAVEPALQVPLKDGCQTSTNNFDRFVHHFCYRFFHRSIHCSFLQHLIYCNMMLLYNHFFVFSKH